MITFSSSNAAFICSLFYKAESTNPYPLNDDRELANQLGVAYFGPSGFFSLPAEDLSESVTSTSASIIEPDSDVGPVMSTVTVTTDTFVPIYPWGFFQSRMEIWHI